MLLDDDHFSATHPHASNEERVEQTNDRGHEEQSERAGETDGGEGVPLARSTGSTGFLKQMV